MCGGNKQQTTKSSTSALPEYSSAYSSLLNQAQNVASTPWNPATGQQVAGFTPTQNQAFDAVQNNQGSYLPNLSAAGSSVAAGSSPVSTSSILSAYNPFIESQVAALQGDLAHQNAQTLQASNSNAAKIGALTGDRSQIAAQIAQDSNNRNAALATSQLQSNAYGQAANIAQGNQQAALQGANIYGTLAGQTQQLGLNDIASLLATGNKQQGQEQNVLNANTSNAQAQAAYPFNTTQWLASLATSLGGAAGSNSSQSTPGPSIWSQLLGGGLAAASLFNRGGRVGYDSGGVVTAPLSAMPYAGAPSYVPTLTMGGAGRPGPSPSLGSQTQDTGMSGVLDNFKQAKSAFQGMGNLGSKAFNWANTTTDPNSGWSTTTSPSGLSGISNYLTNTFGFAPFADGGMVHGYDDGGVVDDIPYGPWDQPSPNGSENGSWSPIVDPAPSLPAPMGLGAMNAPAPQQSAPSAPVATPYEIPQREGLFGLSLSDPARQGLLAAGLGMMASRSPFIGTAIGEGGLAGVRSYSDAKQQAVENTQSKTRIDQEAQRLAQQAKEASERMRIAALQEGRSAQAFPLEQAQRRAETTNLNLGVSSKSAAIGALQSEDVLKPYVGTPFEGPARAAAAAGNYEALADINKEMAQYGMLPMGAAVPSSTSSQGEKVPLEDFLKSIPDPLVRGQTGAVLRGETTLNALSSRSPGIAQQVNRLVYSYDDQFDPQASVRRNEYRMQMQKGPLQVQRQAIGTMFDHLTTAAQIAQDLGPGSLPAWNEVKNQWNYQTGDDRSNNLAIALNNYATEYAKLISGKPPTEGEIEETRSLLHNAMSGKQLAGGLRTLQELAMGRVHELESQGDVVLGKYKTTKDDVLSPNARKAIERADTNKWLHPETNAPQIGEIRKGFRYKGGNPNDKASWEKV